MGKINMNNIEDIKRYCAKNNIVCPNNIAEDIYKCILFERYPITLTKDDLILELYDYFANKSIINEEKEEIDSDIKGKFQETVKQRLKIILEHMLPSVKIYENVDDYSDKKNIIDYNFIYNYILDYFKIDLTGKELQDIYNHLIDLGLNSKYQKINNKLQVAIDNYVIEVLVTRTILKYIDIPDVIQLEKLIIHMQNTNLAIEMVNDPHYESNILTEYQKTLQNESKHKYLWKYLFESEDEIRDNKPRKR